LGSQQTISQGRKGWANLRPPGFSGWLVREQSLIESSLADPAMGEWSQAMKKIKEVFEKFFGIPLPPQMLFEGDLIPLGYELKPDANWSADEAPLLVSEVASKSPPPVVMSMMDSFFSAPEGYYFIGFFDRGINNFGFFYARVDSWRRIYFRLNYAGAYTDSEA
jgi:hypothetical protein